MLVRCLESLDGNVAADMQDDIAMLQKRGPRLHGHRVLALGIGADTVILSRIPCCALFEGTPPTI